MTIEDLVVRRPGEGGSRGVLLAGLLLGIIAAILIAVVLSRGDSNGGATTNPDHMAVVATQDVPAHTRLTSDMLELRSFEAGTVNTDAFTATRQLVNRVTATDIKAGEPIVAGQVSSTAGQGLSFAVSDGMRAVSISTTEVSSAGSNVISGNRVDIVGTFNIDAARDAGPMITALTGEAFPALDVPANATLTFTLLQDIRVLAVAQTLPSEVALPSSSSDSSSLGVLNTKSTSRATTVTLEVTPQQAEILAVADAQGDLRLSLRAFGDTSKAPVNPIILP
jgi:pilus assembly protein CpaB